jgi:hypothetical protein
MVPRGGIEPPTRGFSVRCSTPELPGLLSREANAWPGNGRRVRLSESGWVIAWEIGLSSACDSDFGGILAIPSAAFQPCSD